jgi:hypothetical protein
MQAPWIFSSTFLPFAGEPIDFMLEDRNQPIHGTFVDGIFHSRWADYGPDRVQSWRGSTDAAGAHPMGAAKAAPEGAFLATLMRLVRSWVTKSASAPIATSHRRSRRPATPGI